MQALQEAGKTDAAKQLKSLDSFVIDARRRSLDEQETIKANERAGLEEFNRSAAQLADKLAGVRQAPVQNAAKKQNGLK